MSHVRSWESSFNYPCHALDPTYTLTYLFPLPLSPLSQKSGTVCLIRTLLDHEDKLQFFHMCSVRRRGSEYGNVGQTNSTTGHCLYFGEGWVVRVWRGESRGSGNPKSWGDGAFPVWESTFGSGGELFSFNIPSLRISSNAGEEVGREISEDGSESDSPENSEVIHDENVQIQLKIGKR